MENKHLITLGLILILIINANAQTIRYVKVDGTGSGLSWVDASGDIQSMIDASDAGDRVYVAEGIYMAEHKASDLVYEWLTDVLRGESTERDMAFVLKSGVEVYGGFSATNPVSDLSQRDFEMNETVLTGDLNGDDAGFLEFDSYLDNRYHVVIAAGIESARLDGFTLRGGTWAEPNDYDYIVVNDIYVQRGYGGGLMVVEADGEFSNLKLNNMGRPGYMKSSKGIFENLEVTQCYGPFLTYASQFSITNLNFSDNHSNITIRANDDGLYAPEVDIEDAVFARNATSPAALEIGRTPATPTNVRVNRAYFVGNEAGSYGVIRSEASNLTLSNVVATGNISGNQTGFLRVSTLNQTTTHINIVNSTIVSNYNSHDWIASTGAIVVAGNTAVTRVVNSIIWGNKMGENFQNIRLADGAPGFSIQNSIVQDSFDGEGIWNADYGENLGGNLAEMPEFLEFIEAETEPFSDGDFSLTEGSLGVDAGNIETYLELIGDLDSALDIAGNFRLNGEGIDIGAYEFGAGSPTFAMGNIARNDLSVYPNPTSGAVWVTDLDGPATFEVYNISGQMVHSGRIVSNQQKISLKSVVSGSYILKLTTQKGSSFSKIIKE